MPDGRAAAGRPIAVRIPYNAAPARRGMAGRAGAGGGKDAAGRRKGAAGGRRRGGAPKADLIVLRPRLTDAAAREMIERKKTDAFRTMIIRRPKREDVRVVSVELHYEAVLAASARYTADYYRRAVHAIRVERAVREVVIAGTAFAAKGSGSLPGMIARRGRGTVDVELEEHVYIDNSGSVCLDLSGSEIDAPFRGDPAKSAEPDPRRVLDAAAGRVRAPERGAAGAAVDLLRGRLREKIEGGARGLSDEFAVESLAEVYVPVYEARLVGPRRKAAIMRVDAARKSVI